MGTIKLKKCTLADLKTLQAISRETFTDTFGKQNTPENLRDYLQKAYNMSQLQSEIENDHSQFFFLMKEQEIVGYLKLNIDEAQTEDSADNALEIERIYIRKNHKRKGYGKYLVQKAEAIAREQDKSVIWLGVWEENPAAIAFYEKMGFVHTSSHSFFMGDEEQTDFIMKKKLESF